MGKKPATKKAYTKVKINRLGGMHLYMLAIISLLVATFGLISLRATHAASIKQVLVMGDSIPASSADYIRFYAMSDGKVNVDMKALGGTANCDILGGNGTVTPLATMLANKHYDLLVVSYTGVNFFTPCTGGKTGDPSYDQYTHDAVTTQQIANKYHVPRVLWIQDPAMLNHIGNTDKLNQFYGYMPAYWSTARVFNAATAITPNNQYSVSLPCLPWEKTQPQCITGKGYIQIRSADGVHFYCPDGTPGGNTCASYSSGRSRYGMAVAGAIRTNLGL